MTAGLIALAMGQSAMAQSTFTVSSVVEEAELQDKLETAAGALALIIGGMLVVWIAFRLLNRGIKWFQKSV
jgi:hypothetical protein